MGLHTYLSKMEELWKNNNFAQYVGAILLTTLVYLAFNLILPLPEILIALILAPLSFLPYLVVVRRKGIKEALSLIIQKAVPFYIQSILLFLVALVMGLVIGVVGIVVALTLNALLGGSLAFLMGDFPIVLLAIIALFFLFLLFVYLIIIAFIQAFSDGITVGAMENALSKGTVEAFIKKLREAWKDKERIKLGAFARFMSFLISGVISIVALVIALIPMYFSMHSLYPTFAIVVAAVAIPPILYFYLKYSYVAVRVWANKWKRK